VAYFSVYTSCYHAVSHSFPTRRSSDLIGSIPGAFIGGILLGVIEILARAYISSQMADAIVFAVLIIVLLVKPTGILGKNVQEKRSEEHTSELQSRFDLVCRLLLEKKKH